MRDDRLSPFRDAHSDRTTAKHVPDTPQTRSAAYRLAFADDDFLLREELRPVRLQLELLKPQLLLDERGIESTVVLFGGARIPAPEHKDERDAGARRACRAITRRRAHFARLITEKSLAQRLHASMSSSPAAVPG